MYKLLLVAICRITDEKKKTNFFKIPQNVKEI